MYGNEGVGKFFVSLREPIAPESPLIQWLMKLPLRVVVRAIGPLSGDLRLKTDSTWK
jgi:hypothetical protein